MEIVGLTAINLVAPVGGLGVVVVDEGVGLGAL